MPLESIGRLLIVGGLIVVAVGLLFLLGSRVPFLGRLPGDFRWQRDGLSVYVPLATSLLVSVVLSVLLTLVFRMMGRGE
ncbi:MAG TPA: DUF2905 domain-containing protein [Chloroflexota bacterium]|nr:DUF2905 domain-containing protein [Chloroflexota bacterium]